MADTKAPAQAGPKRTGATVLKQYFGLKHQQPVREFVAELKALPDADFFALRDGIANGSLTY